MSQQINYNDPPGLEALREIMNIFYPDTRANFQSTPIERAINHLAERIKELEYALVNLEVKTGFETFESWKDK